MAVYGQARSGYVYEKALALCGIRKGSERMALGIGWAMHLHKFAAEIQLWCWDAYVQLRVRASTHMRTRMHLDIWKQGAIIICALKCIAVACIIFHHTPTLTHAAHWCKTLNLVLELMKKTYLLRMKAKKLADVCICKRVRFKKKERRQIIIIIKTQERQHETLKYEKSGDMKFDISTLRCSYMRANEARRSK